MDDIAIGVRNLSKRYRVFDSERARLAHALWPQRRGGGREVAALDDVSFEVKRGESFGVIGRNGGGKSTLLQILTGVLQPTAGEVQVAGRVSALLELGSGFNPEYTGRDNVILNGMLLGLTREQIRARFDEIAAFAEIGDAIERPVKTYSSGMVLRLAFAVQVLTDPDILVIDEALAVGDFFFQQKCLGHIRALCGRGVTLVFVSHDMSVVRDLCRRAIYLRNGHAAFHGAAGDAIQRYLSEGGDGAVEPARSRAARVSTDAAELDALMADAIWRRHDGPAEGRLAAIALYGEEGRVATSFRMGETMRIVVAYQPAAGPPTHVAVTIRNRYDQVVATVGSAQLALAPPEAQPQDVLIFDMELGLRMEAGNYSLTISLGHLAGANRGQYLDSSQSVGPISIHWDYENEPAPFLGMFGPPATASFRCIDAAAAN